MPTATRTERAVVAELKRTVAKVGELDELRTRRDELLVELVLHHGYSHGRAAELGDVARQRIGQLIAAATAEADDA